MRRLLLIVSIAVVSLVAAACATSSGASWTYAPPTEAPSVVPSASAAASGEAPASAPASAGASVPASSGSGGGEPVVITAQGIAFTTPEVSAPADAPFVIEFRNEDAGIPHDVVIKDSTGAVKFQGEIVTGVTVATYNVPALPAGSYPFICSVHPNMTGTLKVGA